MNWSRPGGRNKANDGKKRDHLFFTGNITCTFKNLNSLFKHFNSILSIWWQQKQHYQRQVF